GAGPFSVCFIALHDTHTLCNETQALQRNATICNELKRYAVSFSLAWSCTARSDNPSFHFELLFQTPTSGLSVRRLITENRLPRSPASRTGVCPRGAKVRRSEPVSWEREAAPASCTLFPIVNPPHPAVPPLPWRMNRGARGYHKPLPVGVWCRYRI